MEKITKSLDTVVETSERTIVRKTLLDTQGNRSKPAVWPCVGGREFQDTMEKHGVDCRAIPEENGGKESFMQSWHHFSHVATDDGQYCSLLLP